VKQWNSATIWRGEKSSFAHGFASQAINNASPERIKGRLEPDSGRTRYASGVTPQVPCNVSTVILRLV
jgi:hypothetical protein